MSNVQKDFLKLINTSLVDAIYTLGQKVLFEAKSTVPIKTGNLKATGTISKIPGGFKITFGGPSAPYGGIIEDGIDAEPFSNTPYVSTVKNHTRRTSTGTVNVKEYTRTSEGTRPVQLTDGTWVTVRQRPAIKGTRFLKNSLDKIISNDLGKQLNITLPKKITLKV